MSVIIKPLVRVEKSSFLMAGGWVSPFSKGHGKNLLTSNSLSPWGKQVWAAGGRTLVPLPAGKFQPPFELKGELFEDCNQRQWI